MDMQDAAEKADLMLRDTLKGVEPEVSWVHHTSTDGWCLDWKHDSTGTGDVTRRVAVVTVISKERRAEFVDAVKQHWKEMGYKVTAVRNSQESPALFVRSPDGFKANLVIGYQGQAFFDVGTPCVATSAVAPPASRANGPDYTGRKVPLPNVYSDYWSARGPSGGDRR